MGDAVKTDAVVHKEEAAQQRRRYDYTVFRLTWYSTGHKYCNISTGVLVDFHMIHYTQIIWEEVAFSWRVTGKSCCNIYDRYCINVLYLACG